MVVDVLQELEGRIDYDELVVASGDSDFAPLLRCVRTNGRRTMIVSAGHSAYEYRKIAHSHLPFEKLIDLIKDDTPAAIPVDRVTTAAIDEVELSGLVLLEIETRLKQADKPLCLIALEKDDKFARFNTDGTWNGYGAIAGFVGGTIKQVGATHLLVEGGYVRYRKEHEKSLPPHLSVVEGRDIIFDAMKIARLPIVNQEDWTCVLETIAEYAVERNSGNFPDDIASRDGRGWLRDRLMERNVHLSRTTIENIVTEMRGLKEWHATKDGINKMRNALFVSMLYWFGQQKINLAHDDEKQLMKWLGA